VCCTEYKVNVLYREYSECVVQSIQCMCCTEYRVRVLYRVYSECIVHSVQ
jgi:hypothetical protein